MEKRLQAGTIIKSEALPSGRHFGIVIIDKSSKKYVIHNTPYKTNIFGGSVIIEELENYLKEQRILETQKTNLDQELILHYYERNKYKKFNIITFNCESFINKIQYGDGMSNQVRTTGLIVLGALTALNIVLLWPRRK